MSENKFSVIGKPQIKVDGTELVTGSAIFAGDLRFPGMLYGYAARAGVPAGKLKSVDVSKAVAVEGVVDVITSENIGGPNLMGIMPPFDQPVIAKGEIRYAGETIAFVVAESKRIAKKAALLVEADIEAYEPVLTVEEALADGARKIHPDGNVTFTRKLIKGDTAKGFEEADLILEDDFETSFQEHAYIEPEAVCVVPSGDNRLTVYASCQSPYHLRGQIAANIGLPMSKIKVIQAYTGGSFGGKDDVAAEIGILAGVAALRSGKPVMVAHDREESIIGSNFRHAIKIHYKTGLKNDGTITAREVKLLLDGGAYASESPFVVMKALIHAAGPYKIPNVFVESTAVYTNKTYAGAFRGFGVPQVTFAAESQLQEAADRLGLDALAIRRKNALRPGDATATSQVLNESVGIVQTIDAVGKRAAEIAAGSEDEADEQYLYGTGYASLIQGISNGAEGIDVVGASVQMSQDGSVLVGTGLTELGQGSRTVFAQIAAEVLGVPLDRVTARLVDTDSVHDSGATVASRATTTGGMAVFKAATEVKSSLLQMAALMFKTEAENIVLKEGFAVLVFDETARIPIPDVATAAYWTGFPLMNMAFSKAPDADYDHDTHQGKIYIAYNFGTHMMKIRVEKSTGKVEVLSHIASHDVGKVINPLGLTGQVEGASLIGYGLGHMEKIEYENGIIRNPNFADYAVPTIMDRIPTEVISVEEFNSTGPFGAKGVGEPPVAGATASFVNAISDAVGIRFRKIPVTRQDIMLALRNRGNQEE
ncbi:MAG: xanthine dehydrogenase family protein molybdopterin-binding subunit [Spirochaetales bacterium]|nr:xanthine dehydrogenase family protein molybdopterin-binding subunit [Spirochaetales bacterium]